uniref:Uncharacterized protein n=1 Tax=Nelumbo nucifera TaxID=4432 RepID=A0A822ZL51_NELNU|nr:TPA_asm: hypothetical protein HUJ06_000708 [Nelumbo nucifera]
MNIKVQLVATISPNCSPFLFTLQKDAITGARIRKLILKRHVSQLEKSISNFLIQDRGAYLFPDMESCF